MMARSNCGSCIAGELSYFPSVEVAVWWHVEVDAVCRRAMVKRKRKEADQAGCELGKAMLDIAPVHKIYEPCLCPLSENIK